MSTSFFFYYFYHDINALHKSRLNERGIRQQSA